MRFGCKKIKSKRFDEIDKVAKELNVDTKGAFINMILVDDNRYAKDHFEEFDREH